MQAAIVAGGMGTRAAGMTADRIPKALLPVGGVPIIFRQMRVLRREGVTRISVLAGHLGRSTAAGARTGSGGARIMALRGHCRSGAAWNSGLSGRARAGYARYVDSSTATCFSISRLRRYMDSIATKMRSLTVVAHPNDHPRTSDLIVEEDGDGKGNSTAWTASRGRLSQSCTCRHLSCCSRFLRKH